jgi:hypothetical protein
MANTTSVLFIAEQLAELLYPTSAHELVGLCDGFGLATTGGRILATLSYG